MKSSKLVFLVAGATLTSLVLTEAVRSFGSGVFAGGKNVPKVLATGGASCGSCHGPNFPTGMGCDVKVTNRVIDLGTKTTVTLSARGAKVKNAGFNAQIVGSGKLIAGANNLVDTAALQATHKDAKSTSWSITYQADTSKAGLTSLFAVVNDVDFNGRNSGDSWAFHNTNPADTFSTPVRIYTNAKGVTANGQSCPDGNGNVAVYGSPTVPTIGNKNFKVEAFGLPPAQTLYFMMGINSAHKSQDLSFINAKGCFLHTDIFISFFAKTTGMNTQQDRRQANGTWSQVFPVPNLPQFKGFTVLSQVAAVDQDSKLGFKAVWSNGLKITFQ